MYRAFKYLQARVMVACLGGILGSIPFPSFLHAQTGIPAPEISNEVWLNSKPQRLQDLCGKVFMVEFWTFGCDNYPDIEPYVKE